MPARDVTAPTSPPRAPATRSRAAAHRADRELRERRRRRRAHGVAWPAQRFADNGDGTVTDHLTGLVWMKNAGLLRGRPTGPRRWPPPPARERRLRPERRLEAGQWRMPNANELESLVDVSQANPAVSAGQPFVNINVADRLLVVDDVHACPPTRWRSASATVAGSTASTRRRQLQQHQDHVGERPVGGAVGGHPARSSCSPPASTPASAAARSAPATTPPCSWVRRRRRRASSTTATARWPTPSPA